MKDLLQDLDAAKKSAVNATEGNLLILAGPGSGKTLTLVRRTLNIIGKGLAKPEEIVLCSFTEKSARELKERITRDAAAFEIDSDLSGLVVGTIHGICNDLIEKHRHETPLANNFDVLDDITQKFFFFQHFEEIVEADERTVLSWENRESYINGKYQSKWTAITGLLKYFDKIAEELVDPNQMLLDSGEETQLIARAYFRYVEALRENNKIDFAHLQKVALDLIERGIPQTAKPIKYVMVDEFQDTNFIQERIVKMMSAESGNLCVVGDEDQSLYRFRGATVENILQFPIKHENVKSVELDLNYRSEPRIVKIYSDFIKSHDWTNPKGPAFRFDKKLEPVDLEESDYPSVVRIHGASRAEEASQIASLVKYLKRTGAIEDYSQVALLLHSVKSEYSDPYATAFRQEGINVFCPRAKRFFENEEIRFAIASIAYVLDWLGETRGQTLGRVAEMASYVDSAWSDISTRFDDVSSFLKLLDRLRAEVAGMTEGGSIDKRVADYIYQFAGANPFLGWMSNEQSARNLASLSKFFAIFHQYYKYPVITFKNLPSLRRSLFSSFLSFLIQGGADEYEDPDQPFPLDHVQMMTVHQAKGLEFPVIIAGSLFQSGRNPTKELIQKLSPYMNREPFEPEKRIGEFDSMRLFYVSFSRAQNLLVLTGSDEKPTHKRFDSVLEQAKQLESADEFGILESPWKLKSHTELKKSYSFTSDIKTYESCSRQYGFYKELEFAPSRAVTILFGTLVHQTIEDIHRKYLSGKKAEVTMGYIEERFHLNYKMLQLKEVRYMAEAQKQAALQNVVNYWKNNKTYLDGIRDAEVDVSLEKDNYILTGAIDLVASEDGSLEILDFKTGSKPDGQSDLVDSYYKQLCIYAHIFQNRSGLTPSRLVLYWTGEANRNDARMVFEFNAGDVSAATEHFESVVRAIQARDFHVSEPPAKEVCSECDFKVLCESDGTISKSDTPSGKGKNSNR
jgi:DNA helicase-2/ATP-dependent DNA helicase PcrA